MKKLKSYFYNKNVLITGHTGFKGSWMTAWLKKLGAKVHGISVDLPTNPSHFEAAHITDGINDMRIDVRDFELIQKAVKNIKPDYIFHLAAQSLVRKSYSNPVQTWDVNVFGTINILDSLRYIDHSCVVVCVTSDKCYNNVEWLWGYRENDSLGGIDPYSASKAAAEIAIKSYAKSYYLSENRIRLVSVRAGNVIGGGDWAPDRIVPDCINAWSNGRELDLRNPYATRPWQHVLEPLSGYLNVAMSLSDNSNLSGEAFNFGPKSDQNHSVLELVTKMTEHWDKVRFTVPDQIVGAPHEAKLLRLNCDKAKELLKWESVLNFDETVKMTVEWYKKYYSGSIVNSDVTILDIDNYWRIANEKGMEWAR
jgi:CDP-glucose 4,6-dehydratase